MSGLCSCSILDAGPPGRFPASVVAALASLPVLVVVALPSVPVWACKTNEEEQTAQEEKAY